MHLIRRPDPCLWNFTGIYGGCYGPHGTEFLDIGFREIMDNPGEQQQLWLECIKITGDPNIPSGRVSIKAKAVLSAVRFSFGGTESMKVEDLSTLSP